MNCVFSVMWVGGGPGEGRGWWLVWGGGRGAGGGGGQKFDVKSRLLGYGMYYRGRRD